MPTEIANLDGAAVQHIVSTLIEVHGHPGIMAQIEEAATSCVKWGSVLQSLLDDLQPLYTRRYGQKIEPHVFNNIERNLKESRAVLVHAKLPGSTDHAFTIVGDGTQARIMHAWQNSHSLRVENAMPIKDMIDLLKHLSTIEFNRDSPSDIAKLREVRKLLWGSDHMGPSDIGTSSRKRISFNTITSGMPKRPLIESKETLKRLSIALSEWQSAASTVRSSVGSTEWHSAASTARSSVSSTQWHSAASESASENTGREGVKIRYAAGFGAGLGFVLGAGGALLFGKNADWQEVLETGFKTGLALGVGEAIGGAVAKSVTPTFTRAGVSVVRANAAAGVAFFGVFALWDVAKWEKHDITAVQLRKSLAENAAGTAGGVVGGVALGAAGGAVFGPPGALIGGLIGGLAGGFGGAAAGKAIDKAIWDEGEDSVMNSYEFFGWHHVERSTRPVMSAKEITEAYLKTLQEKPSKKIKDNDWATCCTANLMVLLRAMFPEFKRLLKIAEYLRNNGSSGASIIGTTMYCSTFANTSAISPEEECEHTFDGIFLIENIETRRIVLQDGKPLKGKRGKEGGWLINSGFQAPKVVGADANYYNRALWKITHQGGNKYFIENVETKRYLFQDGVPVKGKRGNEGGWLAHSGFLAPKTVGADANYYNRAYWYIIPQGNDRYFIENVETKRYLFQDGEPIKGKRGMEGGWLAHSGFESPNVVGADANYYNRAYFKFIKQK